VVDVVDVVDVDELVAVVGGRVDAAAGRGASGVCRSHAATRHSAVRRKR
jgi:hypothetical protein